MAGFLTGLASPYTGVTDSLTELLSAGDRERHAYIERAWRYYDGGMPGMLRSLPTEPDDNVRTNPVALLVDALTAYLLGEHLDLALKVDDPASDERQRYVDEVWEANGRMALLTDLRTHGGLAGHCFLKLQVQAGQLVRVQPPRLVVLDTASVQVRTHEDDASRAEQYVVSWTADRNGKPVAKRQVIEPDGLGWRITDMESEGTASRWRTVSVEQWPFPWPPVFDCKNQPNARGYYGSPDALDQAMDLVDAINASASNARRVGRLHGHPKVYATGIADTVDLASAPEEALVLPDDATIGVLAPPSTVQQHLDLMAKLEQVWHREVSLPEIAAGRLEGIGQLSGLALRILYAPTVRKVNAMRGSYGAMIDRVNRALLELAGYEPVGTEVRWPDVVPQDRGQDATAAVQLQDAGVSRRTTLEQMGYDPDMEDERRQVEREDDRAGSLGAAMLAFDEGSSE